MLADVAAVDPVASDATDNVDGWTPAIDSALAGLAGSSRRAVELRVVHGSSYEEISDELGCTPLAARIKVSRALAELRVDVPKRQRGDTDER